MFFSKKESRRKKVLAMVDYENIARSAVDEGKIVDFQKLHELLLSFGEIIFAFVFLPENYISSIPADLNLSGFDIVVCQKMTEGSAKAEDNVDMNIIQTGMKFIEFDEVTDIVIIGDDKHMSHLVREAKNRGKKVSVIGTNNISKILRQVIDMSNIKKLPFKDK